jgi:hypothetical protein
MPDDFNYIPLAKAAEHSGLSQSTLKQQVRNGRPRALKVSRIWLTTYQWLDDYLKSRQNVVQSGSDGGDSPEVLQQSLGSDEVRDFMQRLGMLGNNEWMVIASPRLPAGLGAAGNELPVSPKL